MNYTTIKRFKKYYTNWMNKIVLCKKEENSLKWNKLKEYKENREK
jgi:hypothetical protein